MNNNNIKLGIALHTICTFALNNVLGMDRMGKTESTGSQAYWMIYE